MAIAVDPKDPQEVLDYPFDWTLRLAGDTIVSSSFEIANPGVAPDGTTVTIGNPVSSLASPITKVWLAGGALGETALITNRVVTAGGRTHDQTMKVKIKAK